MIRLFLPAVLVALASGLFTSKTVPATPTLAAVGKTYELDIVAEHPRFPVRTTHGVIDGTAADPADAKSYADIFVFEVSLYPPGFVKQLGLKRVVFCKNLSFGGQTHTAVPDFEHETLYLDVSKGRHDDLYVRRVIHHELFHLADLRDDGHLYEDERWANLNPPGFKYGAGGAKVQDDPTVTLTGRDAPGFLNRYAVSGVEEDKAEVFAHMMVEPEWVAGRCAKDKYLRMKVERMTELVEAFSPTMNADFWAGIAKVERPAPGKKTP